MSFKDIFKKSFLEGFASTEITTKTVLVALAIACALALYIFFAYRVITRNSHHAVQCGYFSWHGGRPVHCPFPYRH